MFLVHHLTPRLLLIACTTFNKVSVSKGAARSHDPNPIRIRWDVLHQEICIIGIEANRSAATAWG